MTLSPKKYVSNFTSSTTNRGVEAKEIEIANTRLDVHTSSRSAAPPPPPARRSPPPPHCTHAHHTHTHARAPLHAPLDVLAEPDDTASYIQVEVRRARRSTRLPAASSPAPALAPRPISPALAPAHNSCMRTIETMDATGFTGTGEVVMMPAMMTSCAASTWQGAAAGCTGGGGVDAAAAGDAARCGQQRPDDASEKNVGLSVWRKMSGVLDGNDDSDEEGRPERMEVYYFERGCGAWLATSDAAHEAVLERLARRAARRGRAWLDEVWAVPRLVLAAPLAALLGAERSALLVARGAAVGVVQTAADYALKPALALTFNALVHPPLVFAGNVARAVRDALRPLWGTLGDALEPLARLLANVRVFHVHIERRCSCEHGAV